MTYLTSMQDESKQLLDRCVDLNVFLDTKGWEDLPLLQQALLATQSFFMTMYMQVLTERIEDAQFTDEALKLENASVVDDGSGEKQMTDDSERALLIRSVSSLVRHIRACDGAHNLCAILTGMADFVQNELTDAGIDLSLPPEKDRV